MDLSEREMTRREFLRWSAAAGVAVSAGHWLGDVAFAAPVRTRKLIADALRFSTRPQGWRGPFGFVTFRLRPVFFDGGTAYHIRADASDERFARAQGLVFVPKMALALPANATADYYVFNNPAPGQFPVVSTVPGQEDFTPAYRMHRVTWRASPRVLRSVREVKEAEAARELGVLPTPIVVNYPVVKWPGGEMPADRRERTQYLGPGQLLEPPNVERREVTFKLHQGFPHDWYIVTDTSAVPMAPMMKIVASPKTGALTKAGATAKVLVFGNGIRGPGPMGFQPSVLDSSAGDAVWSSFWDHFTFTWTERRRPRVLRTEAEIVAAERAGDLRRWPGVPDKGELFVVNCSVPVIAPVAWRPA